MSIETLNEEFNSLININTINLSVNVDIDAYTDPDHDPNVDKSGYECENNNSDIDGDIDPENDKYINHIINRFKETSSPTKENNDIYKILNISKTLLKSTNITQIYSLYKKINKKIIIYNTFISFNPNNPTYYDCSADEKNHLKTLNHLYNKMKYNIKIVYPNKINNINTHKKTIKSIIKFYQSLNSYIQKNHDDVNLLNDIIKLCDI